MKTFDVRGVRSESETIDAESADAAVKRFQELHPGFWVTTADCDDDDSAGGTVVGACEACGLTLFSGMAYVYAGEEQDHMLCMEHAETARV